MKTPASEPASVGWARMIAAWRRSGLPVPSFYERRGLQRASFYASRRRLAKDGGGAKRVMTGGFIDARGVAARVADVEDLLGRDATARSRV